MLKEEYRLIRTRLYELQQAGEISEFTKSAICAMINHVMSLITEKYQNVREGVEYIMRGKVLEYEAKTILKNGIQIGRAEKEAEKKAEKEEEVRAMIRDRMDLSLVEKYTHLPMPRIRELARESDML